MGRLSEAVNFANLDNEGMKRYVRGLNRDIYFSYIDLPVYDVEDMYWKLRKEFKKKK